MLISYCIVRLFSNYLRIHSQGEKNKITLMQKPQTPKKIVSIKYAQGIRGVKEVFPSYCLQVLAHWRRCNCWETQSPVSCMFLAQFYFLNFACCNFWSVFMDIAFISKTTWLYFVSSLSLGLLLKRTKLKSLLLQGPCGVRVQGSCCQV